MRSKFYALALFASSWVLNVQMAQAQNPFEARATSLVQEASRLGASPRSILPVLELERLGPSLDPDAAQRFATRLSGDRRLHPAARARAEQWALRLRLARGDLAGARTGFRELGFADTFRIVGPFDNEGRSGFDRELGPEVGRMAAVDPDAVYPGRDRQVSWREFPDISELGYISFDAVYRPDTNVCAFAETFVETRRSEPLVLWLGAGGSVRVYWNGEPVFADAALRSPSPDRFAIPLGAHAGLNRLLVKVCTTDTQWGFFARFSDPQGRPVRGLTTARVADASRIQRGHGASTASIRIETPLHALEAALASGGAGARSDLARYLAFTGSDDRTNPQLEDLARQAYELDHRREYALLAATLSSSRAQASRYVFLAHGIAPRDPEVILARARLTRTGTSPEDALPIISDLREGTIEGIEGHLLQAEILADLGLDQSAFRGIEQAMRGMTHTPRWLALRSEHIGAVEGADVGHEALRALLGARYDSQGVRRRLIEDALVRGDRSTVETMLEEYVALGRDNTSSLMWAAEVLDGLGRNSDVLAMYRRARDLAPEDAATRVAMGQWLLREGQSELAQEELLAAVELRPQDVATRELLENLRPTDRPDEAFAENEQTIRGRARETSGYPLELLTDVTVNTVFESGLGTSFRQIAAQIFTEEGTDHFRTYSIPFEPAIQRVTIRAARIYRGSQVLEAVQTFENQLGEPWYRIYYDSRALVVVFPDLEPGDIVELRYRIDDIAERNRFGNYYGDMHHFGGAFPIQQATYVLTVPRSRELYFNTPNLSSLARDVTETGDSRTYRFSASNLPAIRTEPRSPGATEIAPYLHVSTYASWRDVGTWYWGLIRDQLVADEHLRRTVAELVADAPDTRTKVARIYDWVIRNTRYVGLEFGIHGFLPYRVTQIVERGFGDCKDKASLIYTMLREAGIPAHIVLTRTRRNGAIAESPASLAVFDHAIAYVPELDLYLDGTAEFSGMTDFPRMDQGTTVLHVAEGFAELRQTPVLPADHDQTERTLEIRLAADGSGTISGTERVTGTETPSLRARYNAASTRRERFDAWLRNQLAGVTSTSLDVEGLTDFSEPVVLRFEARVPQIAVRDADGLRVAPSSMGELTSTLARQSERTLPIELGGRDTFTEIRRIHGPRGSQITTLPTAESVSSRFFTLTVAASRENNVAVVTTRLTFLVDRIEVADYAEFRTQTEAADRLLRQRVVFGGAR